MTRPPGRCGTGMPVPKRRQTPAGRAVEMLLLIPPSPVLRPLPLCATSAALMGEDQTK